MFGIGGLELLFLLLLTFLLLGPEDSVKVARGLGRALRFVYRSTLWRAMARMRYEFEKMVQEEIRRSGIPEDLQQLKDWRQSVGQKESRIFPHPPGAMPAASMPPLPPDPAPPADTVSARDHEPTPST